MGVPRQTFKTVIDMILRCLFIYLSIYLDIYIYILYIYIHNIYIILNIIEYEKICNKVQFRSEHQCNFSGKAVAQAAVARAAWQEAVGEPERWTDGSDISFKHWDLPSGKLT